MLGYCSLQVRKCKNIFKFTRKPYKLRQKYIIYKNLCFIHFFYRLQRAFIRASPLFGATFLCPNFAPSTTVMDAKLTNYGRRSR